LLVLYLLILFGAGGVITGEVKVTQGSTHSGHDLMELLLVIALIAGVVPVGLLVLIRGVELLPLEAISDEVGGVAALEAAPR
jgi:hypothetical protein